MDHTVEDSTRFHSRVSVGAVLLAAGQGSRIGSRPKCLLELGGVPLIRRQLIALSGAGADEVVVVLGHYADDIAPLLKDFPLTIMRNAEPERGQVSSLRLGLGALTGRLDAVVVALADQPLISAQDITALIGAYKHRPEGSHVVQPIVGTQIGNPVMFSEDVKRQILSGDDGVGCKQWQAAHPTQVYRWPNDNRHYIIDIDCESDIENLQATTGHQLYWPTN